MSTTVSRRSTTVRSMQRKLPGLIVSGLIATAACGVGHAQSALSRPVTLDIQAERIDRALLAWAEQTGYQVLMLDRQATDAVAPRSVKGVYTPEGALGVLLEGTNLKYSFVNERTVAITVRADDSVNTTFQTSKIRVAAAESTTRPAAESRASSSGQSTAAEPEQRDVETVIVTAQRRAERIEDVPIAISVVGGATLDRATVQGVAETLNRVPGVISAVSNAGARSNIVSAVVVRGVSPVPGAGGNGSTTGYYLDSIPFGFIRRSDAPDSSVYDLERVEVLRGPQGTLYGVSALNGVVRILTKDADLDDFELKARTSVSSTEHGEESYRGDLAVNVPIIEGKLAARAVVGYQQLGGWVDKPIEKDANDATIGNYRLKLNARPTEDLSLGLFAWRSRSDYGGPSVSADNRNSRSVFDEPSSVDFDAYGLKAEYDFEHFSVTSMTSYLDFEAASTVDFAPISNIVGTNLIYLNSVNASKVFAQELVVNSNLEGPWRWSVGAIYRDAKEQLWQTRTNPITGALCCSYLAPADQRSYSESFAVFGEATLALWDGRFEVTGGLRYFEDDVSDREKSAQTVVGGVPAAGLTSADNKFDNVSPRFVLAWHPRKETTVYASYGEGFRSGLNQLPAVRRSAPAFPPVKPDQLQSYEIGAKGSLWDGRIKFDTAVFYIDWQDVQQSLVVFVTPTTTNNALVNAGSASGEGAEFGVSIDPIDGLVLAANFSWNDLRVDSDVFTGTTLLFPKDSRLLLSPERSVSASAEYAFPLAWGLDGRVSAGVNYFPSMIVSRTNAATFSTSDDIQTVRASVAIQSANGWTASLFGENLGNEKGFTARDQFTPLWNTSLRPRTIGLQIEYRF